MGCKAGKKRVKRLTYVSKRQRKNYNHKFSRENTLGKGRSVVIGILEPGWRCDADAPATEFLWKVSRSTAVSLLVHDSGLRGFW